MLSTALFAVAAILFAVVAVLYVQEWREGEKTPPPPPSIPGQAEIKNVVDALQAEGLTVEYLRQGARAPELSAPGQGLTVDGVPLYVFIYENPGAREEESVEIDAATLVLLTTTGTPVPGGPFRIAEGSNVLAVLTGGSDEVAAKVARAIASLP